MLSESFAPLKYSSEFKLYPGHHQFASLAYRLFDSKVEYNRRARLTVTLGTASVFDKTMTQSSKVPSFRETGLKSVITEFALALAGYREHIWRPSGTAIVIAPYLAVTAKHVIEDYWAKFEVSALQPGSAGESLQAAGSFQVLAIQILNEGETGALWDVTRLWLSPFTDVAFLRLTPRSDSARNHKWRSAKMNLMPPPVGTWISGFGYHGSAVTLTENEDMIEVEWRDSPTTTTGEVVEMHERRRDNSMLTFPCFRTNARFEGGMSGGPVFNDTGELCGIICTGSTLAEGDNDHISYVANLWPSMGTEIDMDREGLPKGVYYPVLELAKHGHIDAKHWERIVIVKDSAKGKHQVGINVN